MTERICLDGSRVVIDSSTLNDDQFDQEMEELFSVRTHSGNIGEPIIFPKSDLFEELAPAYEMPEFPQAASF